MNTQILHYLTEASLVWAILLMFYLAALRDNGNWTLRRRFLLFSFVTGLMLPLLPSLPLKAGATAAGFTSDFVTYIVPANTEAIGPGTEAAPWSWLPLIYTLWAVGSLLSLGFFIYHTALHLRPRPSKVEDYAGYRVIKSDAVRTPYTAFRTIYLPAGLTPRNQDIALLHEKAHLDHGHYFEQLFLLAGRVLFWFHPLVWVYGRLVSNVHEFQADAAVTRRVPASEYGNLLLQAALGHRWVPGLFSSPLQFRIKMLTNTVSSRRLNLNQWLILLLLMTGLTFACSEPSQDLAVPTANGLPVIEFTLDQVQNLDKAPKPTSSTSFVQAVYEKIIYPMQARVGKQEGTVSARLTISSTGEVVDVETIRKPISGDNRLVVVAYTEDGGGEVTQQAESNYFSEEVQRVLGDLGPFKPAMVDGVARTSVIIADFEFILE